MTATNMTEESWEEVALLTLYDGVTEQNFALITESFDIKPGEKDIEGQPTVSGGRIVKWKPEGDYEFSAKITPVGSGTETQASMDGFFQRLHPQSTPDNTMPVHVLNTRNRNKYTVAIMWATTLPANATLGTTTTEGYRIAFQNAYVTATPFSFSTSDGLMGEVTIKGPAFTKAGAANIATDEVDATGNLPVLSFS